MQALKNIVINAAMSLALLFGLTVSAIATPLSDFEEAKVLAEKGDSFYQRYLGDHYSEGRGVRQDHSKALHWYHKSADQGDPSGQFSLGYAYANGNGVRQDYSKAFYWHKKAADQGYAAGQAQIGLMYNYGKGIRQNIATAKEWYGKSCDNGFQLGCDYYKELNEQGY